MVSSAHSCPLRLRAPVAILGVPLDNLTLAEALEAAEAMIASREPHYFVTANVDFLVQAQEDVELRRILFEADLVVCDGTPLVWASRLLGNPLPERVAGADLVPLLLRAAAEKGYRVFFLGASTDSATRAVANLRASYPELIIAGHYSPPFRQLLEMDHGEIKRRLRDARPDVLFVAFGCPKQEKWIAMNYRSLGVPLAAGVGGTIDFLAGNLKRAPRWMQRAGAEWLFRVAQEPRRLFRRYVKDLFVFARCFFAQWRCLAGKRFQMEVRRTEEQDHAGILENENHRTNGQGKQLKCTLAGCTRVGEDESWQCVRLPERLDSFTVRNEAHFTDTILADGRHCLLETAGVTFVDSTGIGQLIRLRNHVHATGLKLVLVAPSAAIARVLALMHLEEFFLTAPDFPAARRLVAERIREDSASVALRATATGNTLVWRGEITAANVKEIWKLTQPHLGGILLSKSWEVDLSEVRFIDSSGLGLMVRAKKLAKKKGFSLQFTGLQPAVLNVLRLARMEQFILEPLPA